MKIFQKVFEGVLSFHIDFYFNCKTNEFYFALNSPGIWEKHSTYDSAYRSYLKINFNVDK